MLFIQSGPLIWEAFTLYAVAIRALSGMKMYSARALSTCAPIFGICPVVATWAANLFTSSADGLTDATSNDKAAGVWATARPAARSREPATINVRRVFIDLPFCILVFP